MIFLIDFNFNFKDKNCNGIKSFNIYCKKLLKIKIINDLNLFNEMNFKKSDKLIFNNISDFFLIDIKKYNNLFYYTHSSSLLHKNEKNFFDLEIEKNNKELEFLKNNNKIKIITQTKLLKKFLLKNFNNKIIVLKEPLDFKIDNSLKKEYDVLINSAFYKRKNLELVFDKLKNSKLKFLILTDNIYEVIKLIKKNNIENYKIFSNLNYIESKIEIQKCKILIQFSKLEFLPYSVTEFDFIGNIIVNKDYNWGKLILNENNIFKLKEEELNENIVRKIIEQKYKEKNIENYKKKVMKEWEHFEKY